MSITMIYQLYKIPLSARFNFFGLFADVAMATERNWSCLEWAFGDIGDPGSELKQIK